MKLDRMIGILSVLLQQEKVTAPYLAEKFEVSRRTINRDIEALCMAGIPLITERGVGGGISIVEGYAIDRTLLCTEEIQAILTGLKSLDSISQTNQYAKLMEKLSVGSSGMLTGDPHILIDLSSWYKVSLPPKIDQLHKAILSSQKVSFLYYSPKGETMRIVEPYDLIFYWSSWYVWAWCTIRKDFRLFKLNRMTNLQTMETFKKRPAPLPDLSPEQVFPRVYEVKVEIHPDCKWRLVEEYGIDSFTEQPDGMLLFSGGFSDKNTMICWIASFGDKAKLLEPAAFQQDIWELAEKICQKYRKI